MAKCITTLLVFLSSTLTALLLNTAHADLFAQKAAFIPAERAFIFDFQQQDNQLNLHWQIQPGYYLYRQQIKIEPSHVQLGAFSLPKGLDHHDEFYGNTPIFKDELQLSIPLNKTMPAASVIVSYQGCAESGFCYPPASKIIPIDTFSRAGKPPLSIKTTAAIRTEGTLTHSAVSPDQVKQPFSPLWALFIGIGIAFTPCVLPMYPLISAIILGHKPAQRWRHTLLLAFAYVQGMALTYTLLGLVVAAAGLQFQAAFQHPYILIGLSCFFALLALSMFGLFTLQLPASLQTRLSTWSNQQYSGSLGGVFVMGIIAGLICSPCTTAPLSAILLYIAQSGNLFIGGGSLYLYALGMGLPLIFVTLFGNKFLPKSGPWMETVKQAFGFVILAVPVFLLERVLDTRWEARLWSLLAIAFLLWAFVVALQARQRFSKTLCILFLGTALICAKPLQDWVFPSSISTSTQTEIAHLPFQRINNTAELEQALAQAKVNHQSVMLDLYADWCVACKEFEKYTFSDKTVHQILANRKLLQLDVTANSSPQRELLKHLAILGLPTILFYDGEGKELRDQRITGFMNTQNFIQHLSKLK